jgi:protein tyrosine phosphatase (PTP) superfamily phosphohydrolase (DUF442 family)
MDFLVLTGSLGSYTYTLRPIFFRIHVRFLMRIFLRLLVFLVLAIAAYFLWRVGVHNEATVVPGALYRSAQLNGKNLEQDIAANHIRTVINLRGRNVGRAWYDDEIAVCRKLGVTHVDVRLSAGHLPPPEEMDLLLQAFRTAPRPILMHCRSGSDRTGLGACAFLIDQDHVPWRKAEDALTWRYAHFPIYPYFAMDKFFQLYGQSKNPSLLDWTEKDYPAVYQRESHESKWDEMMDPFELLVHGRL